MKKIYLLLSFLIYGVLLNAQTNIIPTSGSVGIGTTNPTQSLDVRGNILAVGALTTSVHGQDIGGYLQIVNPAKTANGAASVWTIYNMSGAYGNSLQFWAYDNLSCAGGGMCTNRFTLMDNGNVGIGTSTPNAKLAVNGNIRATEVKVETANWPDFVFTKEYELPSLQSTEQHIKNTGHLPGIPSAAEAAANGVNLGEMNAKLLQKIEEITLHLIQQNKDLEKQTRNMEKQNQQLEKQSAEMLKQSQEIKALKETVSTLQKTQKL